MRPFTVLLILTICVTASQAQKPKLAVVISLDQYRGDYPKIFARFAGDKGFNRIAKDGAVFNKCYYDDANTATGPGHSALLTGCYPYRTGIPANEFCDIQTHECGYCASDSDGTISPNKLMVNTVGDLLRAKNDQSKVIAVSIKDRAGVLMAGHNPSAVVWMDLQTKNFTTSTYYEKPVWLKSLQQKFNSKQYAGKTWKAIIPDSLSPAIDDVPWEGSFSSGKHTFPYTMPEFDSHGFLLDFVRSPFSMECLFNATLDIIKNEQLGKDASPDLLCIGVSTTDILGHTFGPDSREVQELFVHLDSLIGMTIDYLDKNVGRKNYVLAITSDHGVAPIPEALNHNMPPSRPHLDEGRFKLSYLNGKIDSILNQRFSKPPEGTWIAGADEPSIFLSESAIEKRGLKRKEVVDVVYDWLKSQPGIEAVGRRDRMVLGICPEGITSEECTMIRNAFYPTRSGDVMIYPKRYWIFGGDVTSHGSTNDYDRWVPMMLIGGPIKKKDSQAQVEPVDLAPTLAKMLGVKMPMCDGKPLPVK